MDRSLLQAHPNASRPGLTFADIDIRSALASRPCRRPDYEAEARAVAALATELGQNPSNVLQALVDTALELCHADTAGVSLLEGEVFRWEALAGVFAARRNDTMPRQASPCGVCVDQDSPQLMHLADRIFPALSAEPRFVEALLLPFHAHGRPIGTVWVVTHTSERQFDGEDLRIMSVLAQFAAAGWQLWRAAKLAEEANRSKDDLFAIISHDLRGPLSAIAGWIEILRTEQLDPAKAAKALETIARNVRAESDLIEDLLEQSRIIGRTIRLDPQPIDLASVIEQSADSVRPTASAKGVHVETECAVAPGPVTGDSARLQRVMENLLTNAIKFTPAGGRVDVRLAYDEAHATVEVTDSGQGIHADFLPHVFDRFWQANPSLTRVGGLGLGLAIVRQLIELHGGTVRATSDGEGQGSTFTVGLPMGARTDAE
ncbi:MAG: GAF domain-containing sensor histidine kinase [Kofleriaceae bacterium]